jgi:hypothetical protein
MEPELPVAGRPAATPVEGEVVAPAVSREVDAGFLPTRPARFGSESVLVRVIATIGVVAIGTVVGAVLVANSVAGWITGLVVASVSVALAAVLWRSRRL